MTIRSRDGFTLVELLVVIAIMGILLGLLLPNLAAVQQTAKAGTQAAIMQSFGRGFMDFSTLDSQGRLSSGAYDHMRDGDMTKVGWVADLVNGKFANTGKSLDPLNQYKVNGVFGVACGAGESESMQHYLFAFNEVRWDTTRRPSDGTVVGSASAVRGTAYFGTSQTVWADGYNTNFATTWHFSRGDNIINPERFPEGGAAYGGCDADDSDGQSSPRDGDGPLSTAHLGDPSLLTSADKIALLGPAQTGSMTYDWENGPMDTAVASTINSFIDPTGRKRIVKGGDFTLESFTDGPNALDLGGLLAKPKQSFGHPAWTWSANNNMPYVHEISDIAPRAKAKKVINAANPTGVLAGGFANVLFADGSTRRVSDNNGYGGGQKGDGWIGPYQESGRHFQKGRYTSGNSHVADENAYDEVRDDIYLGALRSRLSAGGGSSE